MNFITDDQISRAGQGLLKPVHVHAHHYDSVHSPNFATAQSLVFISTSQMLTVALDNKAQGFIILEKSFSQIKDQLPAFVSAWTTPHIQQAMTHVLPLFDRKRIAHPTTVHPTAVIHAQAQIDSTASIGAYAVVQEGAVIGAHSKIGSHTIIEAFAQIGSDTFISPHVFVGAYFEVGSRCHIAPHVTLGSDGFGFFSDRSGHHKIPQIGNVIIEDDCEIGGGSVLDRATLEHTIIKKGSKLDNLCHIAHNVEIGENAILAAAFKVAGSTKIGKNLMTAGNVDVNGHIEICDNVILTGRTGVASSIVQPGIYGGFPAENHRDNIKNMVSFSHLTKIRKNVQKIMKHLKLDDTKE